MGNKIPYLLPFIIFTMSFTSNKDLPGHCYECGENIDNVIIGKKMLTPRGEKVAPMLRSPHADTCPIVVKCSACGIRVDRCGTEHKNCPGECKCGSTTHVGKCVAIYPLIYLNDTLCRECGAMGEYRHAKRCPYNDDYEVWKALQAE